MIRKKYGWKLVEINYHDKKKMINCQSKKHRRQTYIESNGVIYSNIKLKLKKNQ